MLVPKEGEIIQIRSYKHNDQVHRIWHENTVLKGSKNTVIGGNDQTLVTEADGRTWVTREPAIFYFHSEYWFNVIGMLRKDGIYYYCNLSSPFIFDKQILTYIDYDLDVKVFPDMSYLVVDEDEYEKHRKEMNYPDFVDRMLRKHIALLIQLIQQRKGPFAPDFVDTWYDRFLTYRS